MEARLLVFFGTKNRPPSCLFLDFCTHRVWYKPEIFVFGSCHVAVHLISSNVSDLGKSDVGYLQFPFVQKDLTPMKFTADPAVCKLVSTRRSTSNNNLHVTSHRDTE